MLARYRDGSAQNSLVKSSIHPPVNEARRKVRSEISDQNAGYNIWPSNAG